MGAAGTHLVLLRGGPPRDFTAAARVLTAARGLPIADATLAVRSGGGFVWLPLPEAEAHSLAEALTRAGFPAAAVPREAGRAPAARPVRALAAEGASLAVLEPGPRVGLPLAGLRVLHAALVLPGATEAEKLAARTALEGGAAEEVVGGASVVLGAVSLAAGLAGVELPDLDDVVDGGYAAAEARRAALADARREAGAAPELWLELYGPAGRLRLRPAEFHYASLFPPALSSRENQRRLLRHLTGLLPGAVRIGVDELAARGEPGKPVEEKLHERRVAAELARLALPPG